MEDLSSHNTGILLALTSSCHGLIIQWHLSFTMPNQISVVSFCGFCSMHFLQGGATSPMPNLPLFSNWLRRDFGGVWQTTESVLESYY